MKSALLITVRMKSERLPLKVMRFILGKPMIEHMIDRLKLSKLADEIILCTSIAEQDDILEDIAKKNKIPFFRGSPEDVLDRLYNAAKKNKVGYIVNVTADNPLVSEVYIDKIFETLKSGEYDYVTCHDLPIGLFSYGITFDALEKVIKKKNETDTEIWGHFFENTAEFRHKILPVEESMKNKDIRLTVDEKEDLELIRKIFEKFSTGRNDFDLNVVIKYLSENPAVCNINANIIQRATMQTLNIGKINVGEGQPCFIIAEIGVNHNGDIRLAKKLIDLAEEAGVDAVKFQTFKTSSLAIEALEKEKYQKDITEPGETQFEMLKRLELSKENFSELKQYSEQKGLVFLSTPYDEESADVLSDLDVSAYKIGSGEITNIPLLIHVAKKQKPIILSTGASTIEEVEEAIDTIKAQGNSQILLLQCTSNYPAAPKDINLKAMETLRSRFYLPVGYSDHTIGPYIATCAVALGACLVEKHFTIDHMMPGPDHIASADYNELKELVRAIRMAEEAMGSTNKNPTQSETETVLLGRRSLIADADIKKGEIIKSHQIAVKRPGTGLHPRNYSKFIGATAKRDIKKDDFLMLEDIDEA